MLTVFLGISKAKIEYNVSPLWFQDGCAPEWTDLKTIIFLKLIRK